MYVKLKQLILNEYKKYIDNKKKYILLNSIYLAIFLFMFMLPSFSYTSYHSVPLLFAGLLCLLMCIYIFLYGKFFIDKKIIFLIFFCIFCFFSSVINDISRLEKTPFLLTIIFIFFYEFLVQTNQKILSFKMIFYGLFCFSIYFFLSYFREIITLDFERLGGNFGNENAIGQYFHLGIIIGLFLWLSNKKIIYLLLSLFMLVLGMTSGSKTYIFGVLIAIIVFTILFFGRKKWYITVSLSVAGILLIVILVNLLGFEMIKTRILDFLNFIGLANTGNMDYSSYTRMDMMISGISYFSKRPIFGFGYGGFAINSMYNTYSHNTIIDLLCNFGLCGFVCFEYSFFSLIKSNVVNKNNKIAKYMLLVSNIFFHFTSVLFSSKIFYISLAIMCALDKEEIDFTDKKKLFYLR